VPAITANAGEPLTQTPYAADCSDMTGIASVGALAAQAVQPFGPTPAASVDTPAPQAASTTASGGSANFSSDYAMSLLAKITHASADQALTLIQGMLTPSAPAR
jgi:hypothetical protein